MKKFPHDLQTILEPGSRDKIFWGDEKDPLPPGMVRPIFMNTRAPRENENKPLDVQMTVGLGYTVLWRITDPATFFANVRKVSEAEGQLQSMSVTALSEVIASGTADDAITNQNKINDDHLKHIVEKTSNWGVEIIKAGITIINLSHPLASAMRNRAQAEFEAETAKIKADGEGAALERMGEARGKAAHAEVKGPIIGRAEGMAETKKMLKVSGFEILAAQTARDTLPGANATILGEGGLIQAAALGTLFGAGLKSGESKRDTSKKSENDQ